MTDIQVGDVCLDLAQGRPVHVVEATGQDAAAWSEANNYDLCDNYGNSRLGASDSDAVFEVVYCSNAKSEPSKTYAMPDSRLLRVETERADGGRPVRDRIVVDVLERLLVSVDDAQLRSVYPGWDPKQTREYLADLARVAIAPEAVVGEAQELADVERTIGGDTDAN